MNVREFKELVNSIDEKHDDEIVVLQIDPEGNGFDVVRGIDKNCVYDEQDGEVRIRYLTDELRNQGYTEEDLGFEDNTPAIVIYP